MTNQQAATAMFCPACGTQVEKAESIAAGEEVIEQGIFAKEGAHLVVDGSLITVYTHGEGDA